MSIPRSPSQAVAPSENAEAKQSVIKFLEAATNSFGDFPPEQTRQINKMVKKFTGLHKHLKAVQKYHAYRPIPNMISPSNEQNVLENLESAWKLFCRVYPNEDFLDQVENLLDELAGVIEY